MKSSCPIHGYALAVAKQLSDVRYFTPINEPLTITRFSGLYGHSYPHRGDDTSFLQHCTTYKQTDPAKTPRYSAAKRFVRRDTQGQFEESDDVSKSLSADRRRQSKKIAKPGQGDKGDQSPKK